MEIPKYVSQDLKVLENAELKVDKYGYCHTDYSKMAEKLFKIAQRYPQKYLEVVLDYLGYFDGSIVLDEADFRSEILHNAEYCFMEAMDSDAMYGENTKRQIKFINLGIIGGWFNSPKSFKNRYKAKYPSKIKDVI